MVALKQGGVSDSVLAAMAAKGNGSAVQSSPSAADAAQFEDMDLGVYQDVKHTWTAIPSEVVN